MFRISIHCFSQAVQSLLLVFVFLLATPAFSESDQIPPSSTQKTESDPALDSGEAEEEGEGASVSTLLQDDTTTELHDDTTVLRNVKVRREDGVGQELFGGLRIWLGGVVQYDYSNLDGIYSHFDGGERREGGAMRRLEGVVRSQVGDWGEAKVQYDFDQGIFRDVYFRRVSERVETPFTITVGNQKEPIGMDHLIGSKFGTAQEYAAPVQAFGAWRSMGVRMHRSFELRPEERKFDYWEDDSAFMTTSVGVFTEDIEETNDTDLAVTGRVTAGRRQGDKGEHVGVAFSYREGDYYRISMRPEVREADRITLGRPDANTMGIVALEGAFNKGPLHMQLELMAADYAGRIDGYGVGGYYLVGWYLSGESRNYQPKWGLLAPHTPSKSWSTEIFARLSHTRGDDDINGWNDYKSITLGGNVFFRKAQASINVLYGESQYPVSDQTDGMAIVARVQYLF